MYVLYLLGMLQSVFAISANVFLIKLPAIACDIVLALIFYRAARKRMDTAQSILVYICMILNAALIVNSSAWGQIDIIFVLLAVLCIYLLLKERYAPAVVIFVLAVLLKVQAVLIAPIFLYILVWGIINKKTRKKTAIGFLSGIGAGAAAGLLLILPYTGGRPLSWIADLYLNSLGGYSYVSINAFNLYGLLGLNWAPLSATFLGLPFNVWGYIGIASVCVYAAWLYRMDPRGANLFNIAAFITMGVYMFAHSMHERYSFAAPVFLLAAFIFMQEKKLFYASLMTSATVLINQCVAFAFYDKLIPYEIMAWLSAFNMAAFIYMAAVITKNSAQYHKNTKSIRLVANEKQESST